MEKQLRNAKIICNKSGGTARGDNAITYRITLPSVWIKAMGITPDERDVILEFNEQNQIIVIRRNQSSPSLP